MVFDVPHSRFNNISREQFDEAGMNVLAAGDESEVHMAVSEDGFRLICFQGHPEYDTISLHKEYKREIGRYAKGEVDQYPAFPENYYSDDVQTTLKTYKKSIKPGEPLPVMPEDGFEDIIENTWRDSARTVIGNWIGQVYQTTHVVRKKQFMDGIDPDDPLGIKDTR